MGAHFGTLLECSQRDRTPQDEPLSPPPEIAAVQPLLSKQPSDGKMVQVKERIISAEKVAARRLKKAMRTLRTLYKQVGAVACYFVVGYIYYSAARGWSPIQCLLFSVEVIMSVGYGDLLPPATNGALLFTCVYILTGIFIIAMVVASIFESVMSGAVSEALEEVERQRVESIKDLCIPPDDSVIFEQDAEAKAQDSEFWRKLRDTRRSLLLSAACLAVGMAGYGWLDASGQVVDRGLNHLNPFVRALYFSVVTLTTVGFGDAFPVTPWSMCFSSVYMMIGIPTFGLGLAKAASHLTESLAVPAQLVQINKLDKSKLATLVEFEGQLHEACHLPGGRDGYVDACEYMAFVLVRNGVVSMETLKEIVDGFNKLDHDGNGILSIHDLPE